jgi:Cu(I)/Ag(I) efflux system protein CusF
MAAKAITVSATGTVEAIDVSAKTMTIAHGPIAAVKWPAMTMTFSAPTVDLRAIRTGDHVDFKLAVNGMHGEVVEIARR